MRTILLFAFLIFNISAYAQLKFNQHPLESINKWVAVNIDTSIPQICVVF